jgi:competence protein ComEC
MADDLTIRLAVLDVGQGDTIVVSVPETGEAAIIDCADSETVFHYLKREGITFIRGLLITHLHADHYKGAVAFLENCQSELGHGCDEVFINLPSLTKAQAVDLLRDDTGALEDTDRHSTGEQATALRNHARRTAWQGFQHWRTRNPERFHLLCAGERVPVFAGVRVPVIEPLYPIYGKMPDLLGLGFNNLSSVLRINGSGCAALLTGDIEPSGWARLPSNNLRCGVLKFPHHGAWSDPDVGTILDAVVPSIVVLSVGTEGDRYGHPNLHVFSALAERGVHLLCTQATQRCGLINESVTRSAVMTDFTAEVDKGGVGVTSAKGCPCAGTVVIDLADQPRVMQPSRAFHRDTIIHRYYPKHQCET